MKKKKKKKKKSVTISNLLVIKRHLKINLKIYHDAMGSGETQQLGI